MLHHTNIGYTYISDSDTISSTFQRLMVDNRDIDKHALKIVYVDLVRARRGRSKKLPEVAAA